MRLLAPLGLQHPNASVNTSTADLEDALHPSEPAIMVAVAGVICDRASARWLSWRERILIVTCMDIPPRSALDHTMTRFDALWGGSRILAHVQVSLRRIIHRHRHDTRKHGEARFPREQWEHVRCPWCVDYLLPASATVGVSTASINRDAELALAQEASSACSVSLTSPACITAQ